MTKSSASAPRGTRLLTPFSTKPSPVRSAVVAGDSTSYSTPGSVSASAAAGTSSPVNSGRYVACCSSVPHSEIAVATAPGASVATASPMSPWASASATRVPATAERSSEMPPSCSGTPRIGSPISRLALSRSSGAVQVSLASAAAGRTTSAANSVTTSTSICSSSVGVRSKVPVAAGGGHPDPGRATLAASLEGPAGGTGGLEAAAGHREHGLLGLPAQAEPVDDLALRELVQREHGQADRVAGLAAAQSVLAAGVPGGSDEGHA